jgi:hypothetical protein
MTDDTTQSVAEQTTSSPPSRHVTTVEAADMDFNANGLDRIREILLGEILAELERRLMRLDSLIANRSSELQHDMRVRTDALEAHIRTELDALITRSTRDNSDVGGAIRALRTEQHEVYAELEKRLSHVEARLEESTARVERELRAQLLNQAKSFFEELELVRDQMRSALIGELGLEPEVFSSEDRPEHPSARAEHH